VQAPGGLNAAPARSGADRCAERLLHCALLARGSIYFIGNAMQAMTTARQMVELMGSSFMAALVQTAVFLPVLLLALPAGVMADTTARRG
jgi:hypothetical protein